MVTATRAWLLGVSRPSNTSVSYQIVLSLIIGSRTEIRGISDSKWAKFSQPLDRLSRRWDLSPCQSFNGVSQNLCSRVLPGPSIFASCSSTPSELERGYFNYDGTKWYMATFVVGLWSNWSSKMWPYLSRTWRLQCLRTVVTSFTS